MICRICLAAVLAVGVVGCTREPARVAVALGVPDALARPLLHEFASDHGVEVEAKPADAADVDLRWEHNPEPVMELAASGALATLPGDGSYGRPASMIDPARRWIAASAVARTFVYDPARVVDADAPTRIEQLARADVASQIVLADPTRGAATWHAAALFAALGEAQALELYRTLLANGALVVRDEEAVEASLISGERPIALTDTDRAFSAQETHPSLVVSVPDQDPDGRGTFLLPAVVAITARAAANPTTRGLLDFLLSPPVSRRIALTADAILVLEDRAEIPAGFLGIGALRVMTVSYGDLATRLPTVRAALARLRPPA